MKALRGYAAHVRPMTVPTGAIHGRQRLPEAADFARAG
jgi:hypothetical protein